MLQWALMLAAAILSLMAIRVPRSGGARRRDRDRLEFMPGRLLADQLLDRLRVRYVDDAGRRVKTTMIVHKIYGRDDRTPRYVAGFCCREEKRLALRVDQITAIRNLATGESFSDPARALAALVAQAPPPERPEDERAPDRRMAG
jgi:hypothetical protein